MDIKNLLSLTALRYSSPAACRGMNVRATVKCMQQVLLLYCCRSSSKVISLHTQSLVLILVLVTILKLTKGKGSLRGR